MSIVRFYTLPGIGGPNSIPKPINVTTIVNPLSASWKIDYQGEGAFEVTAFFDPTARAVNFNAVYGSPVIGNVTGALEQPISQLKVGSYVVTDDCPWVFIVEGLDFDYVNKIVKISGRGAHTVLDRLFYSNLPDRGPYIPNEYPNWIVYYMLHHAKAYYHYARVMTANAIDAFEVPKPNKAYGARTDILIDFEKSVYQNIRGVYSGRKFFVEPYWDDSNPQYMQFGFRVSDADEIGATLFFNDVDYQTRHRVIDAKNMAIVPVVKQAGFGTNNETFISVHMNSILNNWVDCGSPQLQFAQKFYDLSSLKPADYNIDTSNASDLARWANLISNRLRLEMLSDRQKDAYGGDLNPVSRLKYGVDYQLGDVINTSLPGNQESLKAICKSVTFSVDEKGVDTQPVFELTT